MPQASVNHLIQIKFGNFKILFYDFKLYFTTQKNVEFFFKRILNKILNIFFYCTTVLLLRSIENNFRKDFFPCLVSYCQKTLFVSPFNSFRVFTNGPRDQGSIPGPVIRKTQNGTECDLAYTQHLRHESRVSGAIRGKNLCPLRHLGVLAIEKGAFESPWIMIGQYIYTYIYGPNRYL